MWPFSRKAKQPAPDWRGPVSFVDWTGNDLAVISKAMRRFGQPEGDDWQRLARVALNTLRGGSAVELVARAMFTSLNPGKDPDAPVQGSHYMAESGMPNWCMFVEDARPAVEKYARTFIEGNRCLQQTELTRRGRNLSLGKP